MKTAILVDGSFFLKRYKFVNGFNSSDDPITKAKNLVKYCMRHIGKVNSYRERYDLPNTELYRIFFYDAEPYSGDSTNPVSGQHISFKRTPQYQERTQLFTELKKQRKIALRLGSLKNSSKKWAIRPKYTKALLDGNMEVSDLQVDDVHYPLNQKAVDMKIGLDIATLAFKHQVDQIILIAGDSDFVPAAKFARREGVDFVLDPMGNHIAPSLHEHIDGLYSIKSVNTSSEDS